MEFVGIAGWVVILLSFVLWEVLGLRSARDPFPTFTELVRALMRRLGTPGWVLAFLLWLWLGWHFLVEGTFVPVG